MKSDALLSIFSIALSSHKQVLSPSDSSELDGKRRRHEEY